ncbi:MAG TPA: hypothetical protein VMY39_04590, partial [Planctomycetota bacterium]|nr:hypothetical protein [Planctomycetota bacterium]
MGGEVSISKTKEKCFVCGETVRFMLSEGACLFREARCERCGAGKRHSDLARVILETCLGPDRECLA